MKKQSSTKTEQKDTSKATLFSPDVIMGWLNTVGKVVAPSALLAALMFYFGWVRTNALYLSFGIDQSLLQFSTQDYALRSIQIALGSASTLIMIILAVTWIHYFLSQLKKSNSRLLSSIVIIIGIIGLTLIVISYTFPQQSSKYSTVSVLIPLFWTIGVSLIVYSFSTASRLKMVHDAHGKQVPILEIIPAGLANWSLGLILALLIVGIFSTTAIFANSQGESRAKAIKSQPEILPAAIIYSQTPLGLERPGVQVEELKANRDESFQYRYTGLYLLVRSGGKYFLLTGNSDDDSSKSIILNDSERIRLELSPGVLTQ